MKTQPTLAAEIFRFVAAMIFIAMTMAFIMIPYALSTHPGEPTPHSVSKKV